MKKKKLEGKPRVRLYIDPNKATVLWGGEARLVNYVTFGGFNILFARNSTVSLEAGVKEEIKHMYWRRTGRWK